MTLSPSSLSAEPASTPTDPLAGFGVFTPAPDAVAAPFDRLLTQADATDAAGDTPAGISAPALTAPTVASANTTGTTPQNANEPVPYSRAYYTPFSEPQVTSTASVAPVAVTADSVVGQQVAASGQPRVAGKKTTASPEVSPTEKQSLPTKSPETSSANSEQSAQQLAYQFIAGQWVPQPVVAEQAEAAGQAAPTDLDAQAGAPSIPSMVPGAVSFSNDRPGPEQRVEQSKSEPVKPASEQKGSATAGAPIPAQAGQATLRSTVDSVTPKESASAFTAVKSNNQSAVTQQPEIPDTATQPRLAQESQGGAVSASSPEVQSPLWRLSLGRPAQFQAQEKIAAPDQSGSTELTAGVNSLNVVEEKKPLISGSKQLASTKLNIGTDTANRESVMPHSAVNKAPTVVLSSIIDDGIRSGNGASVTQTEAPIAAQAPKLVQEIRQIADRISSIDRNTVEVRFDFSDTDRLSVRVEYRDGAVHTTFRTDSSQLRDAISSEWQTQSVATEQRPYRLAEPVFSQTSSDRQNSSSFGDSSGRQRASDQAGQPAVPSFSSTGRNSGPTTSAVPSVRSFRPETSLHLQAFA